MAGIPIVEAVSELGHNTFINLSFDIREVMSLAPKMLVKIEMLVAEWIGLLTQFWASFRSLLMIALERNDATTAVNAFEL